jgi:hypothetical protein
MQPFLNLIRDFFVNVRNVRLKPNHLRLDDLVKRLDQSTDEKILFIEKSESIVFVGGELAVIYEATGHPHFLLKLSLYFKNNDNKVLVKETDKYLNIDVLDGQSKTELVDLKVIKFEIKHPNPVL